MFGQPQQTQSNLFAPAQPNIFSTPQQQQPGTSLFGSTAKPQNNLFGTGQPAQSNLFQTATSSQAATPFGTAPTFGSSLFGQTTVATTAATGTTPFSGFGTTTSNIFKPTTTTTNFFAPTTAATLQQQQPSIAGISLGAGRNFVLYFLFTFFKALQQKL